MDVRERAQHEVVALGRSEASDHEHSPRHRLRRPREALEVDAVRDHHVVVAGADAGGETGVPLVRGQRDDRPAPVRREPLERDVEPARRAAGRPERPAVGREHARAPAPRRRSREPDEEPRLRGVAVDDVGAADEPNQRRERLADRPGAARVPARSRGARPRSLRARPTGPTRAGRRARAGTGPGRATARDRGRGAGRPSAAAGTRAAPGSESEPS